MKEKEFGRCISLLLIAALITMPVMPVMALKSGTELSDQADSAEAVALFSPQENVQAFDQELQKEISPPYALTEVTGLSIDPALVNASPYWIYLAAGKKEQLALIDYLWNSDVPAKKKTEWIQFLQTMWKKYPLKFESDGSSATLKPLKPLKEYALTKKESATFAEIDRMIAVDMENIAEQQVGVRWYFDQHKAFMDIAFQSENYVNDDLKRSAINAAPLPDDWYTWDPTGVLARSMNHGYLITQYTPMVEGLGLAPQNTGTYALSAKVKYLLHDYSGAFTDLGYSSHFITDLGQPYHTPNLILGIWPSFDDPFSTESKIVRYKTLHDQYEGFVATYWSQPLPNGRTFSDYANSATGATIIIEPTTSAKYHAAASNAVSVPLYYLCSWHYLYNGNYEFQDNSAIVAFTIERVIATTENTRGLVRFVTGGQAPTLTITASPGEFGSINPSGPVAVNYQSSPTFSITPDSGYDIEDVNVDGISKGSVAGYTFDPVTSDHTISATFRQNLPEIVPLCRAGTPFDSTAYPQNQPQSDPMTFTCTWDGNGDVFVSGSSTELTGVYADDGFTVDTPNGIQFDAEGHWAHQHPPLEITTGMNPGSNTLTLIVRNWMGLSMSYGSWTGIGTDQEPWIIEVNSQTVRAADEKLSTEELPSFISMTGNGLMVNGTVVQG
jgi:hypothetical protein